MSSLYGNMGPTQGMNSSFGQRSSSNSQFNDKVPSGYKAGQLQQFSPEQMQLFQQLFSQVNPESYLSRLAGGDQSLFEEMEAPAMRQFQGLQGNIASRFSGMGGGMGGGARRSSGFQNTMGQQASDFAQDLAAKRQGLQRQAIMDLMGLSGDLLNQKPYDRFLQPKQQEQSSGWGGLLGAGLGGLGGFFSGGPAGALTGAQLGYGIGSGF